MVIQTPRTPPRSSDPSFTLFTPPTPRYAPIDEPDEFYRRRKPHLHDEVKGKVSKIQPKQNTIIPLTPAETPAHRKRNQDIIDSLIKTPNSNSRILFPTNSPVIGSGRVHRGHSRSNSRDLSRRKGVIVPITQSKKVVKEESITSSSINLSSNSIINNNINSINTTFNNLFNNTLKSTHSTSTKSIFSVPTNQSNAGVGVPFKVFNDHEAFKNEVNIETVERFIPANAHPHRTLPPNVPGMWYTFRGKKVFRPFPKGDTDLTEMKPKKLFSDLEMKTVKNKGIGPKSVFSNPKPKGNEKQLLINSEPDPFNSEEDDTDVE